MGREYKKGLQSGRHASTGAARRREAVLGQGRIAHIEVAVKSTWDIERISESSAGKNGLTSTTEIAYEHGIPFGGRIVISKTGVHALTALAALAKLSNGNYAGTGEVARAIGAPRNYLGKLLKALSDQGLVESQKGKGGGFRLARDPATITLLDVMEPVGRVNRWTGCFLGQARCSADVACAVHARWSVTREAYFQFLKSTTVADLVTQVIPNSYPIEP